MNFYKKSQKNKFIFLAKVLFLVFVIFLLFPGIKLLEAKENNNEHLIKEKEINSQTSKDTKDSPIVKIPSTFKEAKDFGKNFLKSLPLGLKRGFTSAKRIIKKTCRALKNFYFKYIHPWFVKAWNKLIKSSKEEIEKRKPGIKEEFQKEKKEMRKEIKETLPRTGKTIWERFKELFK